MGPVIISLLKALLVDSMLSFLPFKLSTVFVFFFGGNFFATNVLGELTSGGMTISVTDTSGTSLSQTLAGNSLTGFAGFRSDLPLASATVRLTSASTDRWASADNVVLSAVPEPQSLALVVLAGAIMLTVPALRRR